MSKFYPLRVALEKNGWQIDPVDPESKDWWSFEIWKLTSIWSPVGYQTRLSFVIDPQDDALIEKNVMGINISTVPLDYFFGGDSEDFSLRPWDECLKQILHYLDAQRRAAAE